MKAPHVIAIDPGVNGAIVLTDGKSLRIWAMPLLTEGKERRTSFSHLRDLLEEASADGKHSVYLERAVPFAMGSKSAFSYGRGFEAIVVAIQVTGLPMTLVEAGKWTKEMHEGISGDLKPKAKSLIAVRRLYPHLVAVLPKGPKGTLSDGPVDALLIAGYALRKAGVKALKDDIGDFY